MSVVVGVGGREAAEPAALLDLVAKALADHGLGLAEVTEVVTVERRAGHPALALLAVAADAGLRWFTTDELAGQEVAHPSARVAAHVGTPSVAEASVLAAGATPLGPPVRGHDWVVAVGRLRTASPSREDATISPTSSDHLSHLGGEGLRHHGDVEVGPGMLDFAVNVHGSEPPEFLRRALADAISDLARYPDARAAEAAVAEAHGVPPESVLLTHGAAEAFTLVAQQPWEAPLVVHPQFTEPEAALRAAGHDPGRLLLTPESGFRLTRPDLRDPDLVVVGNPTNPTSRLHGRAEVEALAGPGRLVLVDEAFLDVVEPVDRPVVSLARTAAADERFVVVRSLTKTYALAGLRVGYLVGHPDRLRALAGRRTPWPVSSLACAAATACASPRGRAYADEVRAALPARLTHLAATLAGHGFAVVDEPRGPFVLARRDDAARVRLALRERGIAVRRGDTFPGLDATWLRFAARDETAVARLDAALAQA